MKNNYSKRKKSILGRLSQGYKKYKCSVFRKDITSLIEDMPRESYIILNMSFSSVLLWSIGCIACAVYEIQRGDVGLHLKYLPMVESMFNALSFSVAISTISCVLKQRDKRG